MKETLKQLRIAGTTALLFGAQLAPALAGTFTGSLPAAPVTSIGGFVGLICTIAGWLFVFLVVLTVVFIILAAFNYLTASGDPEKVKNASRQLIYAAVAIVVAVLARGVPIIVATFVGGNLGGAGSGC